MRYNIFAQHDRTAYGTLVCSVCNKNVTFELEHQGEMGKYGEGSRVLSMLASPKPPKEIRQKADTDVSPDDKTL